MRPDESDKQRKERNAQERRQKKNNIEKLLKSKLVIYKIQSLHNP